MRYAKENKAKGFEDAIQLYNKLSMHTDTFKIHLDHMMDKVDAFTGFPIFVNKEFTFRLHCCNSIMSSLKRTAKNLDEQLARDIT